jgi:ABC-type polysaccharide/polyol phosphate export permease
VSQIPERYRFLALANPAALLGQAYQDLAFHGTWPAWGHLAALALLSLLLTWLAIALFEHYKEYFAEKI